MPFDPWDVKQIEAQAPDENSITAARQVLKKGGFERIESRADGTGWWAVCRGLTDVYNVTATRGPTGSVQSDCTCPSPKRPCKHALALLLHLAAHPELRPDLKAAEAPRAEHLEGLIAAVFASPQDDLPRLVFADYLEENGEADRAALIRASCRAESGDVKGDELKTLQKEVKRLERATLKDAKALFPDGTAYKIRRGFLHLTVPYTAISDAGAMPAATLRLFQTGWVETLKPTAWGWSGTVSMEVIRAVRVLDLTACVVPDSFFPTLAAEVRAKGDDTRLQQVLFRDQDREKFDAVQDGGVTETGDWRVLLLQAPTPSRIRSLAAEGRFSGVETLLLHGGDDAAVAALADSAELSSLSLLDLCNTSVSSPGLIAIGNSRHLGKLSFLKLSGGTLTDEEWAVVGEEAGFRSLTNLVLQRLRLTDASLHTLAGGPAFAHLQFVDVQDVPVTADGVRQLLAARSGLESFHVDRVVSTSEVLSLALVRTDVKRTVTVDGARAEWKPAERELSVSSTADGIVGLFAGLTEWPAVLRVDHLMVENTAFADGAFAELLDFVALGRIRRVTLWKCGLRNADAVALAARLPELALTHLDMPENKIGMTGAKALANSPGLANVVSLDLRGNPILKSGRAALAASVHKTALTDINLGGERVDAAEAKELQKAFGKGVKVTVWT